MKKEYVHNEKFENLESLRTGMYEYIEIWYNNSRIHSKIGFLSPNEYEESHKERKQKKLLKNSLNFWVHSNEKHNLFPEELRYLVKGKSLTKIKNEIKNSMNISKNNEINNINKIDPWEYNHFLEDMKKRAAKKRGKK